jgi:hypothetical protein
MREHWSDLVDNIPGSLAFSTRRMDEGPVLNRIGHLALFLKRLGLKSPQDIFDGKAPPPKWHKLRKHL